MIGRDRKSLKAPVSGLSNVNSRWARMAVRGSPAYPLRTGQDRLDEYPLARNTCCLARSSPRGIFTGRGIRDVLWPGCAAGRASPMSRHAVPHLRPAQSLQRECRLRDVEWGRGRSRRCERSVAVWRLLSTRVRVEPAPGTRRLRSTHIGKATLWATTSPQAWDTARRGRTATKTSGSSPT